MKKENILSWPELLGKNIVDNGFVFLRYTI